METKKCNKCQVEKTVDSFYKEHKRNGIEGEWRAATCKACKDAYLYEYRKNNRDKYNGYMRKRRLNPEVKAKERALDKARYNDPTCQRRARALENKRRQHEKGYNLEYLYGITLEQRKQMFEAQNGCCLICGAHETTLKKKLCVDHCHKTNAVRSLLCDRCNKILGMCDENSDLLSKMVSYLIRYNGHLNIIEVS